SVGVSTMRPCCLVAMLPSIPCVCVTPCGARYRKQRLILDDVPVPGLLRVGATHGLGSDIDTLHAQGNDPAPPRLTPLGDSGSDPFKNGFPGGIIAFCPLRSGVSPWPPALTGKAFCAFH